MQVWRREQKLDTKNKAHLVHGHKINFPNQAAQQ